MATAREILEQRLAKGEITVEEFTRLSEHIGGTTGTSEPDPKPAQAPAPKGKSGGAGRNWLIAIAVLVGLGVFGFNSIKSGVVHVTNLRSSGLLGDVVSGTLITEGDNGYVYLWVEMNNKMMCPKKTYIRKGERLNFEFLCLEMSTSGRFSVLTNRTPVDWVVKNATSL